MSLEVVPWNWKPVCSQWPTLLFNGFFNQTRSGCQMVRYLNAIVIPDSQTILIPDKWKPSCFLMYWSGIQMVGFVNRAQHINRPFELWKVCYYVVVSVIQMVGIQIPTELILISCWIMDQRANYFLFKKSDRIIRSSLLEGNQQHTNVEGPRFRWRPNYRPFDDPMALNTNLALIWIPSPCYTVGIWKSTIQNLETYKIHMIWLFLCRFMQVDHNS